ncbi:hypothetical protein [Peribacillus alkalitolerans]|uniref:hypothetical protein n=1 Tax=Peribacillus alkalitolerans TaxID=1550385 RepID=UPI001968542D|nr:hypothetical protein [Peribacillus alkalitolerans]
MMNNWLPVLFGMAKRQNILRMFGRKRNNRGMLWATLIGLGVSAAAFGIGRNRQNNIADSAQSLMTDFKLPNLGKMPKMAALAEFAEELTPNTMKNNSNNPSTNLNKNPNINSNSNPNSKQ